MEITKELLIDALNGASFGSIEFAQAMETLGFAKLVSSNPEWNWLTEPLLELTIEELIKLYSYSKESHI